jgi:signal peptidase I
MTSATRRPRRALLAGLLMPGLGQIYCGEIARAVLYLLGFALLLPSLTWLAVRGPRVLLCPIVIAAALATLAVYLGGAVAAYRSARRLGPGFTPGPWQRATAYLALFLAGHGFVLTPLASYVRNDLLETFKVPSASMLPAILPGDRFFADKRVGRPGGPKLERGDIAVFRYPNDRTTLYVKRIVGLPGDRIAIVGTSITVNGIELRREETHDLGDPSLDRLLADHRAFREATDGKSYVVLWRKDDAGERPSLTLTVPNGQVFVLGDNRDAAQDSRHFGVLPLADVTALARQVWFSTDRQDGTRLRRVGKLLE